ncbi:MAG: hypothetical protein S4CHLAM102_04280 [Chlamydiia bacterium]|nr:hypothetical protein [Chlamydiia bacterium]
MQERIESTISLLEAKNPSLAFALNLQNKERAESELTLKWSEVAEGLPEIGECDVLILFGLERGRFLAKLRGWLEADSKRKLFVLEPEAEHYFDFFCQPHARDWILHPQVEWEICENESALLDIAWKTLFLKSQTIVHPAYQQEWKDQAEGLFYQLEELQMSVRCLLNEYHQFGMNVLSNILNNLEAQPQFVHGQILKDQMKNQPCVVVGGGASLDADLHLLEQLQEHALVIAGGSAITKVKASGIEPDIATIVDPNPVQETKEAYQGLTSMLAYQNRAAADVVGKFEGKKLWMGHSGGYPLESWCLENLRIPEFIMDGGWNVSTFGIRVAMHLGCSPIILVGMDHAYTHSAPPNTFAVSNAKGEEVYTKEDFYLADSWISECSKDGGHQFINATRGGLSMLGVECRDLEEIARELAKKNDTLSPGDRLAQGQKEMGTSKIDPADMRKCRVEIEKSIESVLAIVNEFENDPLAEKRFALYQVELDTALFVREHIDMIWRVWQPLLEREQVESHTGPEVQKLLFIQQVAKEAKHQLIGNHSVEVTYYEDGSLQSEKSYQNGVLHGRSKWYGRDQTLVSETLFQEGKREGATLRYYPNGDQYARLYFSKDRLHGEQKYYFMNGTLRSSTLYYQGELEGMQKLYWPSGQLKRTTFYHLGKREGKQEIFFESGQRKEVAFYREGKLEKELTQWHENGTPKETRTYLDSNRVAISQWNEAGECTYEKKYEGDQYFEMEVDLEGKVIHRSGSIAIHAD